MAELSVLAPAELVKRHAQPGVTLLAVLHAIQDEAGYIPDGAVPSLAQHLSLSRAEVHGVISYYHYFRTSPPAPVVVQLCRAEACQSMGTEALAKHIEGRTGCRFDAHREHGAASGDPRVELESVYCLGQCALSPALMVNEQLHAKVSPARFDALLDAALAAVPSTAQDHV